MGVAIPAIVVGIIAWFYLSDRPAQAKWLTDEEKKVLDGQVRARSRRVKTSCTMPAFGQCSLTAAYGRSP